jgi:WD40 repeat protein
MTAADSQASLVDLERARRFEEAWAAGTPALIEHCLPPAEHPSHVSTLLYLIASELQLSRRAGLIGQGSAGPPPYLVEDYLRRFPILDRPEHVRRLLSEECRARQLYGDPPEPGEYLRRFPDLLAADPLFENSLRNDAGTAETLPRISGYELFCRFGRGGMGQVYKGRHLALNRVVAVKVLLNGAHADPEELARFRVEAQAVARLRHPNIIQIFDVGACEGRSYLSLEFVEGESLAEKLRVAPLPPREAARLVQTLGQAVQHAHQKGIVHRDLKPANVLLGRDGALKVTDFGLAKLVEGAASKAGDGACTQSGEVLGTPSYMAPEQAESRSEALGRPTDVYALGAILYECLTGRPPFKAETPLATLMQVVGEEPVPPRQLQSRVPRDLETICLKCLVKRPGERYPSARDLADDLGRFLEDKPIWAHPVGPTERVWKWAKRHPAVAVAAVAISIAVLGALVVSTAFYLSERQARIAEQQATKNESTARQEAVRRLVRALVATGEGELQAGFVLEGLRYYAEALRQDPGDSELHRRRLGTLLRQASAIDVVCAHDAPIRHVTFSPDGHWLLTGDDRGLARVWDAASGRLMAELQHGGGVSHGSFSSDGQRVLTASDDKTARLWWWSSNRAACLSHQVSVERAWFALGGARAVTASGAGFVKSVQVWDGRTGEPVRPSGPVLRGGRILLSPDGTKVAVLTSARSADQVVHRILIHNLQTEHTATVVVGSTRFVSDLCFSPDSEWVLAVGDGKIYAWDSTSGLPGKFEAGAGAQRRAELVPAPRAVGILDSLAQRNDVYSVVLSPDTSRLAAGCSDGELRLCQLVGGLVLGLPLGGHLETISFGPDGNTLLTVRGEGSKGPLFSMRHLEGRFTPYYRNDARAWDAATGMPLTPTLHHRGSISRASLSPDGHRLVTGGEDGAVIVWRLEPLAGSAASVRLPPPRRGTQLSDAAFSPDGSALIAQVHYDGCTNPRPTDPDEALLLELDTPRDQARTVCREKDLRHVEFAETERWVAVTGESVTRLYDRQTSALVASFSHPGKKVLWGGIDRRGLRAAAVIDGAVQIWDVGNAVPRRWKPDVHAERVRFSPSGHHVLVLGEGSKLRLYDVYGQPAGPELACHASDTELRFSPDGRRLLVFGGSDAPRLFDPANGAGHALQHAAGVWDAVFSPDGRWVATGSVDGTARIWDSNSGEPSSAPLVHSDRVTGVRFSPDSRWLGTILGGCDVQVWDRVSGRALTAPFRHPGSILDIVFSPIGDRLVTACRLPHTSEGVSITFWDLSPDFRPVEELARRAALLAGFEIEATGNIRFLGGPERRQLWEQVRDVTAPASR